MIKNVLSYLGGVFLTLIVGGMILVLLTVLVVARGGGEDGLIGLHVKGDHAVGVVEITGEILSSEKFSKKLNELVENKKIKGIVVRIDSPGGAVGASEEMYRLIRAANAVKPTVCSLGTIAASGGLFAAVGCKKIIANESTLTGSIGVIMMSPNVSTIMDKVGVRMNVVRSGKLKDAGTPFRDMLPEERDYLQGIIDVSYEQFVRTIAQGRGISEDKVRPVADGRIILGSQAKELGIVDEFGGVERAAKVALELAGDQSEPEIIRPREAGGLMAILKESANLGLLSEFRSVSAPRLMYLSEF